jgi:hypothetical protein
MFDPYHKWLGIPKHQRPPTHYQLLGIEAGEQDVEVIEEAAVKQTTHVRAYQLGAHAAECTRILKEIAVARLTLLNPSKRKEYDAQLAQKSAAAPSAAPGADSAAGQMAAGQMAAGQITASPPTPSAFADLDEPSARTAPSTPPSGAEAVPSISKPGVFLTRPMLLGILGGGAALLVLGGTLVVVLSVVFWPKAPPVALKTDKTERVKLKDKDAGKDADKRDGDKRDDKRDGEKKPIDDKIKPGDGGVDPAKGNDKGIDKINPPPKNPLKDLGSLEQNLLALTKACEEAVRDRRISRTPLKGSGRDPYEDLDGRLLAGFAISEGRFGPASTIGTIRPIYLQPNGKAVDGKLYGLDDKTPIRIVCKRPGYAVGAVTVKPGLGIDGMSVTFMKIKANGLDPLDEPIESDWFGGMGGGEKVRLAGDGAPVVGIFGKIADPQSPTFNGLGLICAAFDLEVAKAPPGKELLQAADIAVPLDIQRNDLPRDLLFSTVEHHVVALVRQGSGNVAPTNLFDIAGKQKISVTALHKASFSPCFRSISPRGKQVSQTTSEAKVTIWALGDPTPVLRDWSLREAKQKLPKPSAGADLELASALLIDDNKLLTVSRSGSMEVWQFPGGQRIARADAADPAAGNVEGYGVQLSRDRRRCVIVSLRDFRVYDTATGKPICPQTPLPAVEGNKFMLIRSVAFSPDGSRFAVCRAPAEGTGVLECFDAVTGKTRCTVSGAEVDGFRTAFCRLGWWGSDHFFINGNNQKPLSLFRAADGVLVAKVDAIQGALFNESNGYDDRLWYCAPTGPGLAIHLLGLPLPDALRDNANALPHMLSLSPQGLMR